MLPPMNKRDMIVSFIQTLCVVLGGLCILPGLVMNISLFSTYMLVFLGIAFIISIGYLIAGVRNIMKNKE